MPDQLIDIATQLPVVAIVLIFVIYWTRDLAKAQAKIIASQEKRDERLAEALEKLTEQLVEMRIMIARINGRSGHGKTPTNPD